MSLVSRRNRGDLARELDIRGPVPEAYPARFSEALLIRLPTRLFDRRYTGRLVTGNGSFIGRTTMQALGVLVPPRGSPNSRDLLIYWDIGRIEYQVTDVRSFQNV